MKTFEYKTVRAVLRDPSEETAMDQARYMLRLSMVEAGKVRPHVNQMPQFANILAHVTEPMNFPFDIPTPQAHPGDVLDVWNIYLDYADPGLWDALLRAIDVPSHVDEGTTINLDKAMVEVEQMAKAGKLPSKKRD